MEDLIEISRQLIARTSTKFIRSLFDEILWDSRLIGIKGARGTGKTTLVLQYLKLVEEHPHKLLYLSLDDLYFTSNVMLDIVVQFYKTGGKIIVLDEVHKYPTWFREIKNLYDRYHDLKIVFTGSSIIDISLREGDLSRRAVIYELQGLSFREYLQFEHQLPFPIIPLETLLRNDFQYSDLFPFDFKPYEFFSRYLKFGYYPFYKEDLNTYLRRLKQMSRVIVEMDMSELQGFDIRQAKKMIQLLYVVAQQVPFKPNLTALAQKTNIHRNSLNNYLYFLEEARLLKMLQTKNFSTSALQKPEKIYLDNSNLLFALSEQNPNLGTIRETFFYNQVSVNHHVHYTKHTDFLVDNQWSFELGGKDKSKKQIEDIDKAWLVKDHLEQPINKSIPIWLFGFLY